MRGGRNRELIPRIAARLCLRYMGIGKPLSNDERDALLSEMFSESRQYGGRIYREAWRLMRSRIAKEDAE
jgi:hypothetical protein